MSKSAAQKLFIKPGTTVWVSHADRRHLIEPLPEDVTPSKTVSAADVALLFGDDEATCWSTSGWRAFGARAGQVSSI